jgi:hypothetical protein
MKLFVITTVVGATGLVIKGLKKSGNNTRKAFSRVSTKSSSIRDIAYSKESSTIWNIELERWSEPWFQEEKY